jgi:hypothetical protein
MKLTIAQAAAGHGLFTTESVIAQGGGCGAVSIVDRDRREIR